MTKRASKQAHELRRHGIERQRARRLSHLPRFGVDAVGEAELPDRALQRHLSRAKIPPRKRMPAHKQKLEDHHPQSEAIMFLRPIYFAEGDSLQFRRVYSGNPPSQR